MATKKMKPEIKNKWLKALRSGDYKQTVGELHSSASDGYCCLGVLCDIAKQDGIVTEEDRGHSWWFLPVDDRYDASDALLPVPVQHWAGFEVSSPSFASGDDVHFLSGMNDGGASFAQIADAIETNF